MVNQKDLVNRILSGGNVRQLIDEASQKYRAKYIVSSERASRRSDEDHVELSTNRIMDVGDSFEMDGLTWYVDEIVSDPDRGIGTDDKVLEGIDDEYDYEQHEADNEYAGKTRRLDLNFDHDVVFSIQLHPEGFALGYDKEFYVLAKTYKDAQKIAREICKKAGYDFNRCVVQYAYEPVAWLKQYATDKERVGKYDVYSRGYKIVDEDIDSDEIEYVRYKSPITLPDEDLDYAAKRIVYYLRNHIGKPSVEDVIEQFRMMSDDYDDFWARGLNTKEKEKKFVDDLLQRMKKYGFKGTRDVYEAKGFSGKGSGNRLDYEDQLVQVFDGSGKEIYSGIEDYEPMKDENWKFDTKLGAYRFNDYIKNVLS